MMTALSCLLLLAPAGPDLVVNGDFLAGLETWEVTDDETCAALVVDTTLDGAPAKVLRLTLKPVAGAVPWQITLTQGLAQPLPAGHRLRLS